MPISDAHYAIFIIISHNPLCYNTCVVYASSVLFLQDFDISFTTNDDPDDESFVIEPADDSINLSTPPPPFSMCHRTIQAVSVPQKVCLMDQTQLDNFRKQLNSMQMCATQGCMGELTPVEVSTFGLVGTVSIKYNCNGCGKQEARTL